MKTRRVILVQSKPGLGKSTLARALKDEFNTRGVPTDYMSLGDQLRHISDGAISSQYSDELRSYRDSLAHHGVIDDPRLIHGIVMEALDQSDAALMIIDGHPRYPKLVDGFMHMVDSKEIQLVRLVILDGTDQFAIERMHDRSRVLFGVNEDPRARLAAHHRDVAPVIAALEARYGALHVNAARPLDEKVAAVVSCINLSSLV